MARSKKPLNIYVDAKLLAAVDKWIASQPVPPTRTASVEAALQEFLDRNRICGGKKNDR